MNESYAEYLIKRKTPAISYVLMAVTGAAAAVSFLLAMAGGLLFLAVFALAAFAAWLSWRNLRIEFEYLYVDRQFSVDRIAGQAKRKNIYECNMEEIQMIAPESSGELKNYKISGKALDFTSHIPGKKVYGMVVQKKGENQKLLIEADEKLLHCFRQTAPRKVIL